MPIKKLLIGIALLFAELLQGQPTRSIHYQTSFNRLGWAHQIGYGQKWQKHIFVFGAKWYEPDFVFEDNWPGLFVKYNWQCWNNDQWGVLSKIEADFFVESKGLTNFWLTNPMVGVEVYRRIGRSWQVNFELSTGAVFNGVTDKQTNAKQNFQYINYQAGVGVVYHFGSGLADEQL
jgi:hypothetical protein